MPEVVSGIEGDLECAVFWFGLLGFVFLFAELAASGLLVGLMGAGSDGDHFMFAEAVCEGRVLEHHDGDHDEHKTQSCAFAEHCCDSISFCVSRSKVDLFPRI